jgi:hypothetical protein
MTARSASGAANALGIWLVDFIKPCRGRSIRISRFIGRCGGLTAKRQTVLLPWALMVRRWAVSA